MMLKMGGCIHKQASNATLGHGRISYFDGCYRRRMRVRDCLAALDRGQTTSEMFALRKAGLPCSQLLYNRLRREASVHNANCQHTKIGFLRDPC